MPASNKRAAWACMVLFLDLNGYDWADNQPHNDESVDAMMAVAAREVDESWLATWLEERVTIRPAHDE